MIALFDHYKLIPGVYDEIINPAGEVREDLYYIANCISQLTHHLFTSFHNKAHHMLTERGVTFSVYSNKKGTEKIFPFDIIPRVIVAKEWEKIEAGLLQRITALNAFLCDIYSKQQIIADHIIPKELIFSSLGYLPQLHNVQPPGGVYIHIAGIDLVREPNGEFVVLEDNLRVPSGISYVLENREVMKTLFSDIFMQSKVRTLDTYALQLKQSLYSLTHEENANMVVLTPGPYNSAYFEHVYLARKMGCPLVSPNELYVENNKVFLKSINGPIQIHIIYRRIDDDYLDTFFNPQSLLSVPGIVKAYAAGHVVLANALGNGVADDKAIYCYVPAMIRYYLSEEPILPQVKSYVCYENEDYNYVTTHLNELVVKIVDQSGGYGIFIGPQSSKHQVNHMLKIIAAEPRRYIAQPLIELSSCPTWSLGELNARRVDLRPYILTGKSSWVLPGALTRVALKHDSYVVNSSQGGGAKDTWVLS